MLAVLLVVRVTVAIAFAPPVYADSQGYDAAALKLVATGTYSFPLYTDYGWFRVGGQLVVTPAGRAQLMSRPPNAYIIPGYVGFLALLWRAFGVGAQRLLVARVAQALLSVGSAAIAWSLGKRFSERIGVLALGFAALYPPMTFANSYLLTEPLYTFLFLLATWLLLRWVDLRQLRFALAAGVLFGLSLWVRPVLVAWLPIGAVIVLISAREWRRQAAIGFGTFVLVALVILSPWWVRNERLYHALVLTDTHGAGTLIDGLGRDFGAQQAFPWERNAPVPSPRQAQLNSDELAIRAALPAHPASDLALEQAISARLRPFVADLVKNDFGLLLSLRLRSFAISLATPEAVSPTALHGIPYLLTALFQLVLLGLGVFGALTAPRRTDTAILISLVLVGVLIYAVLIPIGRYYFPVLPILFVFAAYGASRLAGRSQIPACSGSPA